MGTDTASLLAQCETDLREGRFPAARKALDRLISKKLPRELVARTAQLSWRLSAPEKGLKILHKVVCGTFRVAPSPSDAETAEYAACLIKGGAHEEGDRLLRSANPQRYPRVFLYQSFALVAKWDYAASIAPLQSYVAAPGVSAYDKLVGLANLAAAYVHERDTARAESILGGLVEELMKKDLRQLLYRVLLVRIENLIYAGEWKKVMAMLDESEALMQGTDSIDSMLHGKYRAIATFMQSPRDRSATALLAQARVRALEWGHAESVRDLDRVRAVCHADEPLFWKVYFGTPWQPFREAMIREFPKELGPMPEVYEWELGGKNGPSLDATHSLKEGQVLYRLAIALVSDFYRPLPQLLLHSAVFPGAFYPTHSAVNLRQAITRLRKAWARQKLPLIVEEKSGAYRLRATADCRIRVASERIHGERIDYLESKLRHELKTDSFKIGDAARIWRLSERSALRIVDQLIGKARMVRLGEKRGTRYRFSGA